MFHCNYLCYHASVSCTDWSLCVLLYVWRVLIGLFPVVHDRNADQWPQKLIMQLIPQQLLVREPSLRVCSQTLLDDIENTDI